MQQKKKIYIPRGCCDSAAVCCVLVGLGEARGTPLRRTWGSLPGRLSAFGCFSSLPPPPLGLGWPCQHCSLCSRDVHRRQNVLELRRGPAPSWLCEQAAALPSSSACPSTPVLGPWVLRVPWGWWSGHSQGCGVTLPSLWCRMRAGIGCSGGAVGPLLLPACCSLEQKRL